MSLSETPDLRPVATLRVDLGAVIPIREDDEPMSLTVRGPATIYVVEHGPGRITTLHFQPVDEYAINRRLTVQVDRW